MMIKPYGDTLNDGAVQLSFTLPVPQSTKAQEAARQYTQKMGFNECEVVYSQALSDDFTFFVVYAHTDVAMDYDQVHVDTSNEDDAMDYYGVNEFIEEHIGRKIVVVGACTGFDAHTVGIDAIMNMKGYDHHYGLERYPQVEAYNLGAQVPNERLIEFGRKVKADALLVSQIVTQKDIHIQNMTNLIELMEAENIRDQFVVVAGGPRISNKLALELGYDAGFGQGSFAEHVASFIVKKLVEKRDRLS